MQQVRVFFNETVLLIADSSNKYLLTFLNHFRRESLHDYSLEMDENKF